MQINDERDILDPATRKELLFDIVGTENKQRRDEYLKRHEIYHDRAKEYVLQLAQEEGMSEDAITHMSNRMPGLSILRKLINKKARVYSRAPQRKAENEADQQIVDELADALELDLTMKKVNRWLELHKNVMAHVRPVVDRDATRKAREKNPSADDLWKIDVEVWNPSIYDVIPDPLDETKPLVVIFSFFDDTTSSGVKSGYREGDTERQAIAGPSRDQGEDQISDGEFVWWSPSFNFTTDENGQIIDVPFPGEIEEEDQIRNPINRLPFVNFNKDQNMTFWAEGGEDLVNGSTLINLLLADLYFISKYQGMGLLTIAGKNVPKEIKINPNNAVVFDMQEGDPTPSVNYASANPPIAAHISMIEQLVAMLLTTNDLEPGAISGTLSATNAASGIQELIQRAEPTSAIEDDQAIFIAREPKIIELVLAWATALKDTGRLTEKFAAYAGRDEMHYNLMLPEPEAFANEEQRINAIIKKKDAGLMTKKMALRELNPDLDDDGVEALLAEIDEEKKANAEAFGLDKAVQAKANPFEKDDDDGDEARQGNEADKPE